jgi:hypothetical protein
MIATASASGSGRAGKALSSGFAGTGVAIVKTLPEAVGSSQRLQMDYDLQHDGCCTGKESTETTPEQMGASARAAISGTMLSADLCSCYALTVGISVFLLVSVFLGDCCVGSARSRLSQIEDVNLQRKRGLAWQGFLMLPAAWERRDDAASSIPARRLKGRALSADCRAEVFGQKLLSY